MAVRVLQRIARHLGRRHSLVPPPGASDYVYWTWRARTFGSFGVLNITHAPEEQETVTEQQRRYLLPLLRRQLAGDERRTLDYGCGPGRFAVDLADAVGGLVVAADPIPAFLDAAPHDPRVEYVVLPPKGWPIPLADDSMDVVWICLVLGAIADDALGPIVADVGRVLRPGGLLFLVENTSDKADGAHWTFRTVDEYRTLLPQVALAPVGEYEDVGETISVFAGRLLSARAAPA